MTQGRQDMHMSLQFFAAHGWQTYIYDITLTVTSHTAIPDYHCKEHGWLNYGSMWSKSIPDWYEMRSHAHLSEAPELFMLRHFIVGR